MAKQVIAVALFMFSVNALFGPTQAEGKGPEGPCIERSWIPRTGMPTAEKEWRFIRLVNCAVDRWWPGEGHARTALAIADRESCLSCTFAINYRGCYADHRYYGCYGAFQQHGKYLAGRWAAYLRPDWFRHWPVSWHNARAQVIVSIRMFAANGGPCPDWC